MARYHHQPLTVTAHQWTGTNIHATKRFLGPHYPHLTAGQPIPINTRTGRATAHPGDWIVRDTRNNLTVATPREFAERYTPAHEDGRCPTCGTQLIPTPREAS